MRKNVDTHTIVNPSFSGDYNAREKRVVRPMTRDAVPPGAVLHVMSDKERKAMERHLLRLHQPPKAEPPKE